jgi:hypothetical protein
VKPNIIRVYHGSIYIVEKPEVRPVNRPLDFGVGFYVTTLQNQAEHWAQSKARKIRKTPVINIYDLDLAGLKKNLNIKEFKGTSNSWLDFVLKHRKGLVYDELSGKKLLLIANQKIHHSFDAVSGEVADDDVFDSLGLYEQGIISKNELRLRIKTKHKNNQICFCTPVSLSYLKFVEYYTKG